MYEKYWGLDESPFRGGLDPASFYPTAAHEEALARLNFLLEERRRLGMVCGPVGIGKSLLLELFARQVANAGGEVVRANLVGAGAHEVLWTLAVQCGLNPALAASEFALWRRLADRLIENRYERTQLVVLLDDVDDAEREVFPLIVRLAQFDPHPDSRLTIVLASSENNLARVHPRLLELAELAVRLEPWEPHDTRHYLEHALRHAGREAPLFTLQAIGLLHELTGGIPLRIKQLADLALMAGAGLEQRLVDADLVEGAYQELGVAVPAPARNSASR